MRDNDWTAISVLITGLMAATLFTMPAAAAAAAATEPATGDSLASAIEAQLDVNAPLPAAYAVVDGNDITFGGRQGAGPETPFVVGSVSKSFTALAVMVAVDRGEISLDAPVTDYFPDFRLAGTVGGDPILIQHLLNHTSGISTTGCNLDAAIPGESLKDRVDQLQFVTPESEPGEQFTYCNVGFAILARVLEESSGRPFADVLQSSVLTPLGMARTYTDMATARENGLVEGHTTVVGFPVIRPENGVEAALADGYVMSTARDLATYAIFQMGDGKTSDGTQLISSDLLKEMHRGTVVVPGFEGTEQANYAMGWFTADVNGTTIVNHGGTTPRYHANVAMVPSEQLAVIDLVAGQWLSGAGSTSAGAVSLLLGQDAGVSQLYGIVTAALWLITLLLILTIVVSWRRSRARKLNNRRPKAFSGPLLVVAGAVLFVGLSLPGIQETGSLRSAILFGWENTPDLLVLVVAWPLALVVLGVRSIVERVRSRGRAPAGTAVA